MFLYYRKIPEIEHNWITDHLTRYFHCQLNQLPVEFLTHKFLILFYEQMNELKPYSKCIKSAIYEINDTRLQLICQQILQNECPVRFGLDYSKSSECRYNIHEKDTPKPKNFTVYDECKHNLTRTIERCVKDVQAKCTEKNIVATKTVRLTMETAENLLRVIPDLKIVHYIRDPRAVALSRQMDNSFRGIYALKKHPITRSAKLYCQDLIRDLTVTKRLKQSHPESIMEVYFEELATFPELVANKIYSFIHRDLPISVKDWLRHNTQSKTRNWTSRNSAKVVTQWTTIMSNNTIRLINKYCRKVFNTVDIVWPLVDL